MVKVCSVLKFCEILTCTVWGLWILSTECKAGTESILIYKFNTKFNPLNCSLCGTTFHWPTCCNLNFEYRLGYCTHFSPCYHCCQNSIAIPYMSVAIWFLWVYQCQLERFFSLQSLAITYPDREVQGANMGPIWGRQDPGRPHVGPCFLLSEICSEKQKYIIVQKNKMNFFCVMDQYISIDLNWRYKNIYNVAISWQIK